MLAVAEPCWPTVITAMILVITSWIVIQRVSPGCMVTGGKFKTPLASVLPTAITVPPAARAFCTGNGLTRSTIMLAIGASIPTSYLPFPLLSRYSRPTTGGGTAVFVTVMVLRASVLVTVFGGGLFGGRRHAGDDRVSQVVPKMCGAVENRS